MMSPEETEQHKYDGYTTALHVRRSYDGVRVIYDFIITDDMWEIQFFL